MKKSEICPFCNSLANSEIDYDKGTVLWECPTCGRFKLSVHLVGNDFLKPNFKDMVATYLFYNGVHQKAEDLFASKRQYIWLDNEPHKSDENNYFEDVTMDQIKAFYNVNFTQKISMILLDVAKRSRFFDNWVRYSFNQILSMTFGKRWDNNRIYHEDILTNQILFILSYLKNNHFIDYGINNPNGDYSLKMLTSGWARVENTEQDNSEKKNVFIAMSFDESMNEVKETIKKAIISNGYIPRIMDEIEHNNQIVPEMLYEIRQAKFLIAELTNHNNGAYFEAGYALGVGKDVIQVCRKDTFREDGHFDVKQVNTILWKNQEDLYKRLDARIKATIS